jgi:hypothetical protein
MSSVIHATNEIAPDTMPVESFGCMTKYFCYDASTMSTEDSAMLAMMQDTMTKLTTKKYTDILDRIIKSVFAAHRVAQFGIPFDAFKGQKVHASPGLRDTGHCGCDEDHGVVISAGCKECCATWPEDVHQCDCERFVCEELHGLFAENGCMHPGDFDQDLLLVTREDFGLCLICLDFESNGMECEHSALFSDLYELRDDPAWISGEDEYSDDLKLMMSKDAALQILTDNRKRKAAMIGV